MNVHDWSQVDLWIYHDFHQSWIVHLDSLLNAEILPEKYYALIEPSAAGFHHKVLTNADFTHIDILSQVMRSGPNPEVGEVWSPNRVGIYNSKDDSTVSWIELVAPDVTSSEWGFTMLFQRSVAAIAHGCSLILINLHPPSDYNPQGIHAGLFKTGTLSETQGRPLEVFSHPPNRSFKPDKSVLERFQSGSPISTVPIFLPRKKQVEAPLDAAYELAWNGLAAQLKKRIDNSQQTTNNEQTS